MFSLLIVEDDKAIRDMLRMFLESHNYKVLEAVSGKQAISTLDQSTPDLMILDWMLPDMDGLSVIKAVRNNSVQRELPVLMLTARAEEADKIKGLDFGADDYMTKPVSLRELDARARALIRRSQGLNTKNQLTLGRITISPENKTVTIDGEAVKISGKEYRLLHFFMKSPERIYSRAQLLDYVWGQTVYVEERTVDVHVMRLRKILKAHHADKMLQTVRGAGYRFMANDIDSSTPTI